MFKPQLKHKAQHCGYKTVNRADINATLSLYEALSVNKIKKNSFKVKFGTQLKLDI